MTHSTPIRPLSLSFCLIAAFLLARPVQGKSNPSTVNVPSWARTAVWYQIFPERFRNGDPSNDPKREDLLGSWPHEFPENWQASNWTGDWYALQAWESGGRGFYYHAQHRRYGGDLQGVMDKLDYLKELGITAIYFNPLFESPSLHKYDAAAFHHIDDNFGPDPVGDRALARLEDPLNASTWKWTSADLLFLKLIGEAHRRGIRVVIDGVFNHVGLNFWAFRDLAKNQQASVYKDWFTVHQWDNPATPKNEFEYEGWAGVKELPEIREDENGLIEPYANHVFDVVRKWMDPNGDGNPSDGIDGWRLDVAEKVGIPFWRKFRQVVREINPEAYLVGEVWWEDWRGNKMFNAAPWLQGDVFDAVMNYRWAAEAFRFFAAEKTKISAVEFTSRLEDLLGEYPSDANQVLLNLYSSHDTDRFASRIRNADLVYDHNAGVGDNRSYDISKPDASDRAVQKLMILFQMTYIGAPTVYYGEEAGMWGADDPDCRKPMLWDDLTYQPESAHPFGVNRTAEENAYDHDLHDWYASTIRYRLAHPSLSGGALRYLNTGKAQDVLAYQREINGDEVIVVLNNSGLQQNIEIPLPADVAGRQFKAGLGQGDCSVKDGSLRVTLAGKSGIAIQVVP